MNLDFESPKTFSSTKTVFFTQNNLSTTNNCHKSMASYCNKEDLNYSASENNNFDFEDEHFESADANAADTFPVAAGDLKKNDFVCIRGRPCKILDIETFKNGKHGSAKCSILGEDIFVTGKKYELVCPAAYPMPCPAVSKAELQLIDISEDGELTLLDEDFEERQDLDLPLKECKLSQTGLLSCGSQAGL